MPEAASLALSYNGTGQAYCPPMVGTSNGTSVEICAMRPHLLHVHHMATSKN